jgi:hypothetical protein
LYYGLPQREYSSNNKKAYASCIRYTRNSREDNNSMATAIAGTPTAGTTKAGTTKAGTPGTLETPVGEKTAVSRVVT